MSFRSIWHTAEDRNPASLVDLYEDVHAELLTTVALPAGV